MLVYLDCLAVYGIDLLQYVPFRNQKEKFAIFNKFTGFCQILKDDALPQRQIINDGSILISWDNRGVKTLDVFFML